ncbi:MAG: LysR family transcriptional regulator [Gammaproteobacteria bacterium]|nr:LysR family transcriptional regulator [Gammaproteobacteria bacterium]
MMDDLKRMIIFAHVVEAESFSDAARRLGIAKSAVSKHISQLEENLGVRLLNRSTRKLSLTDVGDIYYQRCAKIVEAVDEATDCITPLQDKLSGTLRISSPVSFGVKHVVPLLNSFLQTHTSLKSEILLDDNIIDLVQEGVDVAIRVGWLADSSLRARKLSDATRLLCASPNYLQKMGIPKTPDELTEHEWVIFTLLPSPSHCTLTKKNKSTTIQIKGRIKINNGNAVRTLLLEGAGIAALPDFLIAEDLQEGRLVRLLPDYEATNAGIYAVYQDQRLQQAKARTFIDFLVENIKSDN